MSRVGEVQVVALLVVVLALLLVVVALLVVVLALLVVVLHRTRKIPQETPKALLVRSSCTTCSIVLESTAFV